MAIGQPLGQDRVDKQPGSLALANSKGEVKLCGLGASVTVEPMLKMETKDQV